MLNIMEAMGYANERAHTGMICYMVQLYQSGNRGPLNNFLKQLFPTLKKLPAQIQAVPEWNYIDLVLMDGESNPFCALELKIDGHEGKKKVKNSYRMQTIAYQEVLSEKVYCGFITLGAGEYYAPPYSDNFKHIKLSNLRKAVDSAISNEGCQDVFQPLKHWCNTLETEEQFRQLARDDNFKEASQALKGDLIKNHIRKGLWNIYLLAGVREAILSDPRVKFEIEDVCQQEKEKRPFPNAKSLYGYNPRIYFCGSSPDTILNIWFSSGSRPNKPEEPPYLYAEINRNAMLNIKAEFYDKSKDGKNARQDFDQLANQRIKDILTDSDITELSAISKATNSDGKTRTLASIDIGLKAEAPLFNFDTKRISYKKDNSPQSVAEHIIEIVEELKRNKDKVMRDCC